MTTNYKNIIGWLIDPITGRRYLPENKIWVGNINNVEEFKDIKDVINEAFNCRDLKARYLLLFQMVRYFLNSRLILPTKNKYAPNAQALDDLQPCILRHNNGVIKNAVPGTHYVDYLRVDSPKLCVVDNRINSSGFKFIDASDLSPQDIHNHFDDFDEFKKEYEEWKIEIKTEFEAKLEVINNIVNNINTVITNLPDFITNNTNVTNIINDNKKINNEIKNIYEQIEEIINHIHNSETFNINDFIEDITNKYEYLYQFLQDLQQTITNIENINLPDNYFSQLNEEIQNIYNKIQEIINNYTHEEQHDGDTSIEINENIDLGDFIVDLQNLITSFANFQAFVNLMLFSLLPLLAQDATADTCIAWALNHDILKCCWQDRSYSVSVANTYLQSAQVVHSARTYIAFRSDNACVVQCALYSPTLIFDNPNSPLSLDFSLINKAFCGWSFYISRLTFDDIPVFFFAPFKFNKKLPPLFQCSVKNNAYSFTVNGSILCNTDENNQLSAVNIAFLSNFCSSFVSSSDLDASASALGDLINQLMQSFNTLANSTTSRLDNATQNINTLTTNINTLSSSVSDHETRISTLENSSSSSSSSFPSLPHTAFIPPSVLRVGSFNLSVPGVGDLLFDAIACHPLTGQWVVTSSNLPGAIAYSDDDGVTWHLHNLQLSQETFQCQGSVNVCPYSNGWLFSSRFPADLSTLSQTIINSGLISPYFLDCCNVLDIKQLSHSSLSGISLPSAIKGNINNLSYDAVNDIIYVVSATKVFKCYGVSKNTDALNNWTSIDILNAADDQDVYSAINPWSNYLYLVKTGSTIAHVFYNGVKVQSIALQSSIQSTLNTSPISGVVPDALNGFTLQQYGTISAVEHTWTPSTSIYRTNISFAGSNGIIFTHPFSNSLLFLSSAKFTRYSLLQKTLYNQFPFNWDLLPSGTSLLKGGYRRAFDFSPITGKTIILTNSGNFLYC